MDQEEVVKAKDAEGKPILIDRGKIGERVLTLAENGVYSIIIPGLTIAEVHKKKGCPRLPDDENQNILDYFEYEFVTRVPVDRAIREEANRLCRKYEDEGLFPCDAIHLACAKKAGCDVLLSWDAVLNTLNDPDIRTEQPRIQELPDRELSRLEGGPQTRLPFDDESNKNPS